MQPRGITKTVYCLKKPFASCIRYVCQTYFIVPVSFQGPVHSYVAIPGGKTCYLSELKAGKEVLVVDQNGQQRTAIVGRVKIETRPLVIVEAKVGAYLPEICLCKLS